MNFSVRDIESDTAWDALVDQTEHGTVYHRAGWLATLQATTPARFRRLVLEVDGRPAAIWPVGFLRKGPFRIAGSPLPGWNTAYMGPLFTNDCSDRVGAVNALFRSSPIRRPAFMATRLMDTTLDLSSLGFRKTRSFETYEIDLSLSEQSLWDAMKGTCRTRIRKGEKNGLEVREETDGSYLEDFWAMATDVFAKSNQRPDCGLGTSWSS